MADKEPSVTHYKQHPLRAFPPAFPSRAVLVPRSGRLRSGIRQDRKDLVQSYLPSTHPQSPRVTSVVHMYLRGGYLTSWITASTLRLEFKLAALFPRAPTGHSQPRDWGEEWRAGRGPPQSWETMAGFSGWSEVTEYLGSEIPIRGE